MVNETNIANLIVHISEILAMANEIQNLSKLSLFITKCWPMPLNSYDNVNSRNIWTSSGNEEYVTRNSSPSASVVSDGLIRPRSLAAINTGLRTRCIIELGPAP